MKRFSVLILAAIILISCQTPYTPRNITSVTIKSFPIENTSIRAIQVIDSTRVAYAGSSGVMGVFSEDKKHSQAYFPSYQDSIKPNFRSIAFNGSDYFALSIGNPALLYKLSEEGEAFFAASNTNIKIKGSTVWIASGGKKARILKSNDYGKTWDIFNTPLVQGKGPQGIYSIDFYDMNHGIVMGGDYSKPLENTANKAITTDGGKTWKLVADSQIPNYKSCVQYVPGTQGQEIFAVGKTGIAFSNDAGNTWKNISKESYYAIQFVDINTAWLSGNNKIGKLVLK